MNALSNPGQFSKNFIKQSSLALASSFLMALCPAELQAKPASQSEALAQSSAKPPRSLPAVPKPKATEASKRSLPRAGVKSVAKSTPKPLSKIAAKPAKPSKPAEKPKPSVYSQAATSSIGSISVGHPNAGFLLNGVPLPKDPRWVVSVPQHRFGTEETIQGLTRAFAYVHERFPHSPPVMIGSLSPQGGGFAPPHKSHRTGRDVDVYFYRTQSSVWFKPARKEDIDYPRTWTLLKAFLTQTEIDYVLLDQELQVWFREYAASIGEDPLWLKQMFEGEGRYPNSAVKHAPGHSNHFHVRFASPLARERGRLLYDRLVLQGHVKPAQRQASHAEDREPIEVPGARDAVSVASFPKPGEKSSAIADALSGLSAVEKELDESLLKLQAAPPTTARQR